MRALSEFKPPQPNSAVIWFCELLLPLYVRVVERLNFKFLKNPSDPLKFLKDKSTVIVMNHGDRQDPLVLIALAKHMGEAFYCVVARECFDWSYGMLGWLFQKLGCYSINRGVADFRSVHTTREILTNSNKKLLVFPEAEITGDEQKVHHFNRSFIHLLLESQDSLAKKESMESIWVLPVGVSYRLETPLETSVSNTLRRVERRLGIDHSDKSDAYNRVLHAVDTVVQRLSDSYKCTLPEEQPRHEQVRLLARHICERISAFAQIECEKAQSEEEFLYFLRNHVLNVLSSKKGKAASQQKLSRESAKAYREFVCDLDRVERLLILHRILKRKSTPIRVCRILDFLEAETCGRMGPKGRQCATIFFGKPIEVLPYLESYTASKETGIDELSACIRNELQAAFDSSHAPTICESSNSRGLDTVGSSNSAGYQ